MKWIKYFESFDSPGISKNTFWEGEFDGDVIHVTLDDVLDCLDSGFDVDPNDLKHLLIDVDRNPVRVNNADLSYPIILVKHGGEFISILDGQHRVVKAIQNDEVVKCRILDLDLAPDSWRKVFLF